MVAQKGLGFCSTDLKIRIISTCTGNIIEKNRVSIESGQNKNRAKIV